MSRSCRISHSLPMLGLNENCVLMLCSFCLAISGFGCGRAAAPGPGGPSPTPAGTAGSAGESEQAKSVRSTSTVPPSTPVRSANGASEPELGAGGSPAAQLEVVDKARHFGWSIASGLVARLEQVDEDAFPGVRDFARDVRELEKKMDPNLPAHDWPIVDLDTVISQNPDFWRATYEIVPGDPLFLTLHSALLLGAGEAYRAAFVSILGQRSPRLTKETKAALAALRQSAAEMIEQGDQAVQKGVELFDQGDRAGALKLYEEALMEWPQNPLAHYEIGLTVRMNQLVAEGESFKPGTIELRPGSSEPDPAAPHFAQARRHNPLQRVAYQGGDPQVIQGLFALSEKGLPAWEQIVAEAGELPQDLLIQFGHACQTASAHELALVARQIVVSKRGRFDASDHPFIATSLRTLVPGEQTEAVLERLAGSALKLVQLTGP